MAVLAVAALGSMVGGSLLGAGVLGMSGASIGWLAGSMLGNSLFGPTIEGPKLTDKKVQISSYGAPISLPFGGVRVAGNVIWSTDLVEHKRKSGGKGGPKVTKYSYTVSCATAIGEGPIVSIRRIWADAKCVYDAREDAPASSLAASAKFAQYFTLYTGSESQLPDPTMESKDGAGNVPAYRGTAYVVFADMPLDDYGNRIPSFTFEISTAPAIPASVLARTPLVINPWVGDPTNKGRPIHAYGGRMSYLDEYGNTNTDYATAVAVSCATAPVTDPVTGHDAGRYSTVYVTFHNTSNSISDKFPGGAQYRDNTRYMYIRHANDFPDVFEPRYSTVYNASYCTPMEIYGAVPDDQKIYFTAESNGLGGGSRFIAKLVTTGPTARYRVINACTNYPNVGGSWPFAIGNYLSIITSERMPSLPPPTCSPGDPCGAAGIAELPDDPNFCISCDGSISFKKTWHYVTGTAKQLCSVSYNASAVLQQQALGPLLLPDDPNYSSLSFWQAQFDAAIADGTLLPGLITRGSNVTVSEWAESDALNINVVAPGIVRLSEIVSKLSLKGGLTAGQIDVTQLTDFVLGYTVGRQSSARQAIDQLRSAYFFDAVESNEIIKYVKRGQTPIATIIADDLGASEDGNAALIEISRKQETELPATVNVAYSSRAADYQTSTQISKRQVSTSVQEATVELSIVMGEVKALQVADALLYDAFASRTTRVIQVTRQFAHIEPTDVIQVTDKEGFTYTLFVKDKTEDGGMIRLECQDQDKSAYNPAANGDPTDIVITPGPSLPGPTKLVLLDIPLLRESDVRQGYYVAVAGYRAAWKGAYIYRSDDAGATYIQKLEATNAATIGYCVAPLAAFAGGNVVDESSMMDVRMQSGATVSSITRAQLLNGANAAMVGGEVIQFQRAALVSTGVYRLTGLLRGRLGTEQYISTHIASEMFVLLDPTKLYRIEDTYSSIGTAALYKGVTYGDPITAATAQTFTDTGASLKALAPVHVGAGGIGGGLYRVNWKRRTRYGGEWLGFVDVPLDMAIESYNVKVTRSGATVSEALVTGATTADIAAISGDLISVSQISDRVGLGYTATITAV